MKKPVKITLLTLASLLGAIVLTVGGYVGYVAVTYTRLGDGPLEVTSRSSVKLQQSDIGTKTMTISTYNIGFGAYDRDYSFFMDVGSYKEAYQSTHDQVVTTGKYARATSQARAQANTVGAFATIAQLKDGSNQPLPVDFALYQEVDTESHRAHFVNQLNVGIETHQDFDYIHATNFHSAYLAYPLSDPIGKSTSGISTFSRYQMEAAERHEFTVSTAFPTKYFDLDRCFSVSKIAIEGSPRALYIFNVHLSAYDASGLIRAAQMVELKAAIAQARDIDGQNNYVIVGGDFNHDLVIDHPNIDPTTAAWWDNYEQDGMQADWYNYLRLDNAKDGQTVANLKTGVNETYVADLKNTGMAVYADPSIPTCRDASIPFQDENSNGILDNFACVIDGFIVSDNITVSHVQTVGSGPNGSQLETLLATHPGYGLGFVYSDHNPVYLQFSLNAIA